MVNMLTLIFSLPMITDLSIVPENTRGLFVRWLDGNPDGFGVRECKSESNNVRWKLLQYIYDDTTWF